MPLRAPRPQFFTRAVAFFLVHFCRTVTLARLERAIIEEVCFRAHHAKTLNAPSPNQWIPNLITRWRIRRATRKLHATLERWRFSS